MSDFCTIHWEGTDLPTFYKAIVCFNIFLTTTGTLGNSLILVAFAKDSSLHAPSRLLLRSLTVTDLCVSTISQPLAVTLLLWALNEKWNLCRVIEYSLPVATAIFSGASLSILTAIGVDRLLALLLRFRYRQVVTIKRVRAAVFVFWIKSSAVGAIYICGQHLFFIVSVVLILLEVVISSYSYVRIFLAIRRQQTRVQVNALQTGNTTPNMARYRRTVSNALWVHLTLMTCYIPFAIVTAVIAVHGPNPPLAMAEFSTLTLVYMNSSLNPLLYCWKIKEVREAVKETIRQFYACFSTQM